MSRDDTLFKDDDGKAYFISAANENADLMLYELADDYLTIKRQVMRLSTAKREAPAMFKQGGRYYIITSAATGWDPNQAQYFSAASIEGPWTSLTNLGNSTTYDTQSAYVIPVQGSQATTYIYAGDRWQDPDLVGSKYIWLPLKISGTSLSLDYYAEWQLNLTTGRWSRERRLHSPVGMDAALHRQRGDAGRGRPRPQRLRRFGGDDLAHAVHGDGARAPARDPDRPRRDVRADRLPLPSAPGQGRPRHGRAVPVLRQHRSRPTGGPPSRRGRSTAIATRSA